jgi:hypothetical protein
VYVPEVGLMLRSGNQGGWSGSHSALSSACSRHNGRLLAAEQQDQSLVQKHDVCCIHIPPYSRCLCVGAGQKACEQRRK